MAAFGLIFTADIVSLRITGFLFGFSYGFIYIVMISYIADNASKNYRGFVTSIIALMHIIAPLFLRVIALLIGIVLVYVIIAFIIAAILLTWMCANVSVSSSLEANNVQEAVRIFTKLNGKALGSDDIRNEIDDKIKMMEEERTENDCCCIGIFNNGNWKPLISICGLHLVNLLAWCQALRFMSHAKEFIVYLALAQIFILTISRFTLDNVGRRILFWISCIASITIMMMYFMMYKVVHRESLIFAWFMSMALGIEPVKHVYTSEAFPISKRNESLAFVTIVENFGWIIQYVLINEYFDKIPVLSRDWLILANTILLATLMLSLLYLPETKQKSIRNCRSAFNKYYKRYNVEASAPNEIDADIETKL